MLLVQFVLPLQHDGGMEGKLILLNPSHGPVPESEAHLPRRHHSMYPSSVHPPPRLIESPSCCLVTSHQLLIHTWAYLTDPWFICNSNLFLLSWNFGSTFSISLEQTTGWWMLYSVALLLPSPTAQIGQSWPRTICIDLIGPYLDFVSFEQCPLTLQLQPHQENFVAQPSYAFHPFWAPLTFPQCPPRLPLLSNSKSLVDHLVWLRNMGSNQCCPSSPGPSVVQETDPCEVPIESNPVPEHIKPQTHLYIVSIL